MKIRCHFYFVLSGNRFEQKKSKDKKIISDFWTCNINYVRCSKFKLPRSFSYFNSFFDKFLTSSNNILGRIISFNKLHCANVLIKEYFSSSDKSTISISIQSTLGRRVIYVPKEFLLGINNWFESITSFQRLNPNNAI